MNNKQYRPQLWVVTLVIITIVAKNQKCSDSLLTVSRGCGESGAEEGASIGSILTEIWPFQILSISREF